MSKTIVEYEGEIPSAVLEGKIGEDDFYTPEEIRKIILDAFPKKGEKDFDGLEYIAIDPRWDQPDISDLPRRDDNFKEFQSLGHSREEIMEEFIPNYEKYGVDLDIAIIESTVYKKKNTTDPFPFETHEFMITLTDLGYVFNMNTYSSSNNP